MTHIDSETPTAPTAPTRASDYEVQADIFGIQEPVALSDALQEAVALESTASPAELEGRKLLLVEHNLDALNANATPDAWSMSKLEANDWQDIQESADPYLSLWSRSNLIGAQRDAEFVAQAKERYGGRRATKKEAVWETAFLESLPLVHGTTLEAVKTAILQGSFVSNRSIHEQGSDAMATGSTLVTDRTLGLDNYVFADFARPHMHRAHSQAEVTVVFRHDALTQPGTFATLKDNEDCLTRTEYLRGLVTAEDFYAYAQADLSTRKSAKHSYREGGTTRSHPLGLHGFANGDDADTSNLGTPTFSTYEVKMPNTDTSYIDKLIFKNQGQYDQFVREFGDAIPAYFQPDLSDNLADTHNQTEFDLLYAAQVEKDFEERVARLEGADDTKEAYAVLGIAEENPRSIKTLASEKLDPTWLMINKNAVYDTMAEASQTAKTDSAQVILFGSVRHDARRVAIAKIRTSPSARCSVTDTIEWIDI